MHSKKKITFVINYFYPDVASTGQLMTELCMDLQDDFDITVIAAQPGYAGEAEKQVKLFETDYVENIKVIRLRLPRVNKTSKASRFSYMLSYFVLANAALLKEKRTHTVYTISQPPVLGGMIGTVGKVLKRSKHVYNIQDFNPEQAQAISYTKNEFLFKAAKWADKLTCRMADHVVVVGHDMGQTLRERFRFKAIPTHSVINNWTNEADIVPLPKEEKHVKEFLQHHGLENKFIVMYSGNLGLYYDLENVIKVAGRFHTNPNIAFVFIGEGAVKKELEKYVKETNISNIHFFPYQPKEKIKYSLNAADVHLVVNQKGIKGVSVPSKVYGVMAAGKPILGVLEQGSEAEMLIQSSQCGVVVEPQEYDRIADEIETFYRMSAEERKQMGRSGRLYLEEHLKREVSINKYRTLLHEL